jgi:very-short-patch-repair endonuclease
LPPAQFHAVIAGCEVDFWIVDSPLVLECDGWDSHGRDRRQFESDRTRDAELAAIGFVVRRFTYRAIVKRPAKEADRIRRIIQRWAPHLLVA